MATPKALRTQSSGARRKQNQLVKVGPAMVSNSNYTGIINAIPQNPRLRRLAVKTAPDETFKVIVVKVNPELNRLSAKPLNPKAARAKNMFANFRKSH